jgi:hypothetical protein
VYGCQNEGPWRHDIDGPTLGGCGVNSIDWFMEIKSEPWLLWIWNESVQVNAGTVSLLEE